MDFSLVSSSPDAQRLLEAFMARRSPATRATYLQGLKAWAQYLGAPSAAVATQWLIGAGVLEGNARVLEFLDAQKAAGLSANTLSIRLAALRSMVSLANLLGLCTWSLQVRGPKAKAFRDTRGPGPDRVQLVIRAAAGQASKVKASRDVAICRFLHDLALRRGEVASLRFEDVDLDGRRLWVKAKGAMDRDAVTLPEGTAAALNAWLTWRGQAPGPLFHRLDNAGLNLEVLRPLTGRAVWDLVNELAGGCGFDARPHGFRHSAITEALDAGFTLPEVHQFGRWQGKSYGIIQTYDDNRRDRGGEIAGALARRMEYARIQ